MQATELYLADGKCAGLYYCGKCRVVHRTLGEAEACCVPRKCGCGADVRAPGWTVCDACRVAVATERKAARFAAATKVPAGQYDGPVFADVGPNDGYFATVDDMLEWLDDEGESVPAYVWSCHVRPIVRLDCDDIIERATEDAYDDWDKSCLVGLAELAAAMAAFNEANKAHVTWTPDYTRAVVIREGK